MQENTQSKNNTFMLAGIVLILVIAGGLLFLVSKTNNDVTDQQAQVYAPSDPADYDLDRAPVPGDEIQPEQEGGQAVGGINLEIPEGAFSYNFSGTSAYAAQKRFIGKEVAEVVGTTSEVRGLGYYSADNSTSMIAAEVELSGLQSDSGDRDSDIIKFFNPTLVTIRGSLSQGLTLGSDFSASMPLTLTINGVEKEVLFDVTGQVSETTFTAQGTSRVNMSDFNINPPSLASVYTVDDAIELRFSVTGQRSN